MGKLLYQDDDGDPQEVPKDVWEEVIEKARQDAADELKDSNATADQALARMRDKMKNVDLLLELYKKKFGDPHPDVKKEQGSS
jgi:hypothetical protein